MTERESGEKAGEKGVVWDKEIDVPEKWIQFVDDNVLAREPSVPLTGALSMILNMCRASARHESQGHLRPRSQLLDKNSRIADRAGRWISYFIFLKGSISYHC